MLQAILLLNVITMFLFWLACMVMVALAYNHFIQYGETGGLLPVLTQIAIDRRLVLLFMPILWIISFWVYKTIRKKQKELQLQFLLLFLMVSMSAGFLMLIFYGTAGILPYLKIGVIL